MEGRQINVADLLRILYSLLCTHESVIMHFNIQLLLFFQICRVLILFSVYLDLLAHQVQL